MSTKIKGRLATQIGSSELTEMAQGTGKSAGKARRELERRAAMAHAAKSPDKPERPQTTRKKAA